ncbi:MAG: hypothetical protein ACYCW6_23875 [Candidatus Xenobia bacterium]
MRSIVLEGDKVEAPCEKCGGFVPATWRYLPYRLADGRVVDDVMQAQCDTCGQVVAAADQSAHLIKQALDDRSAHRTKVRLPQEMLDFVSLQLSQTGLDATAYEHFWHALFRVCLDQGPDIIAGLIKTAEDPALDAPRRVTVNLSMGQHVDALFQHVCKLAKMDTSKVIRRLIVLADGELHDKIVLALRQFALVPAGR